MSPTIRQHMAMRTDDVRMAQDGVSVPSKFNIAWPSDPNAPPQNSQSSDRASTSSETESDVPEASPPSPVDQEESDRMPDLDASRRNPLKSQRRSHTPPNHPKFSRALSMPLPSQLGHLQNPHRVANEASSSKDVATAPVTPATSTQFRELSLELADSVQMAIQTMLQISPSQVLDPAKEQFSACSLSIPTPSMSAMFTTMKNLNYISANMAAFCVEPTQAPGLDATFPERSTNSLNDFDVGELLQSVGDALSGAAAQAGVDLVLFHGDVGMNHVSVRGDESGISYALSHIIRQVLTTTQPGDSIELGLYATAIPPKFPDGHDLPDVISGEEYRLTASPIEVDGPVRCTFEISHKFGSASAPDGDPSTPQPSSRPQPVFSTCLLRSLLRQVGAKLVSDLPPKTTVGRACELTLTLNRGSPELTDTPVAAYTSDPNISNEPTLEELSTFAEGLRGKKVALYASSKGSFAHHLTSYLTSWGLDVSHISTEPGVEEANGQLDPTSRTFVPDTPRTPSYPASLDGYNSVPSGSVKDGHLPATGEPVSFIFIDDDVKVLRERLQALRFEQPPALGVNLRKRPSLAANHRPRSSQHINRATVQNISLPQTTPVVIVHFTSLSNYKHIREVIQSALSSYAGTGAPIPEVMIIPKPAGPRRFLTALHTAVTKPLVDPFFTPIATTPMSPGMNGANSFFNFNNGQRSPTEHRPSGTRSNSDRSTRSPKEVVEHSHPPPPSPLGVSDSMEYFAEASSGVKLGNSPSSGLVIQSPDGQPAGIFFHPRARTLRTPSSATNMEREKGQLFVPSERRSSISRRPSNADMLSTPPVSFSTLHIVTSSPKQAPLSLDRDTLSTGTPKGKSRVTSPPSDEATLQLKAPALSRRPSPSEAAVRRLSSPPVSPHAEASSPPRRVTRRPTQERPATPASSGGPPRKGKTKPGDGNVVPPISVLVVDDNPINQTILSTFMKKKKIKFDVAGNGEEAVEKWLTGGFHLILMDIQMPVMDGIQATKEIRRLEKANATGHPYSSVTPRSDDGPGSPAKTPSDVSSSDTRLVSSPFRSSVIIVALTASSLQSDRVAALAAGCNDFLTKPVSLLWLNNKIIEWGSIKALQMWADLRPDAARSISSGQAEQARVVADRLHVPAGRSTPSPSRPTVTENGAPALPPPPSSDPGVSTAFRTSGQPSPNSFWGDSGQRSAASVLLSPVPESLTPDSKPPEPPVEPPPQKAEGNVAENSKCAPALKPLVESPPGDSPPVNGSSSKKPGEATDSASNPRKSSDDQPIRSDSGESSTSSL